MALGCSTNAMPAVCRCTEARPSCSTTIPTRLVREGVRDMLRISDARMRGTSYDACVLHVAPEAFVGGNLALIKTGDMISIDIPRRRIEMEVSDEELDRRRAAWQPPVNPTFFDKPQRPSPNHPQNPPFQPQPVAKRPRYLDN